MVNKTRQEHQHGEDKPTDDFIPSVNPPPIPAEMNSFIGRTGLLSDGMRLLTTARLVTLIGTGGVGKTRLLLRMAKELTEAGAYKHGVVVVRLTDLKEADDRLESTIAAELGILDNSATPGLARLIEYFRHRQMLLMLDNCEHLVGQSPGSGQVPRLLTTLLKAAPGLQVMTTSRVRLGVQGEHLLIVSPLCVGPGERCGRDGTEDVVHEAQRLLIDRAAEAGVHIREEDYPLAARLCQLLDGIPQAIELAAPLLSAMTLQEMVDHPRRLHLLTDGPSEQGHHRTLHAMIDWSYDLLPEPERRTWALVSVFEGGFDLEAAQAICTGRGIEKADVLGLLARLVRQSLLVAEARGGRTRYRMLETIREYGQELIATAGEERELRQAHADYFDALVERCTREWFGPGEIDWMNRLRVEMPNLRAAQEFFLADPASAGRGLEMAIRATRTRFFVFSGALNEAGRMLAMGLDGRGDTLTAQQVAGLSMSSWVALIQGNQILAGPLLAQAEDAARQLGMEPFGPLLYGQGTQRWLTEADPVKAREALDLLARAEAAFRTQGTPGDVFMAMLFLGMATSFLGDADRAFAEAARVLAAARASGAQWCISWALWNNALAELLHGDPDTAAHLAQEGLRLQQATGDTWGPIWSLWLIAVIAATRGDFELAGQLFGGANAGQRITQATVLGLFSFLRVQQRAEAAARRELGDDEFEIQVAIGESLPTEEIYALAAAPFPTQRKPSAQEMLPGGLSDREFEVAGLVAKGMTNREIGLQLHISFRTVEEHIRRINRKLGVAKRLEIAAWYLADAGRSVGKTPG
ncbi:ATP-binding protein [Amycolatopsis sp. NPDC004378]